MSAYEVRYSLARLEAKLEVPTCEIGTIAHNVKFYFVACLRAEWALDQVDELLFEIEIENWEHTNAPDIATFHPSRITPRLAARASTSSCGRYQPSVVSRVVRAVCYHC